MNKFVESFPFQNVPAILFRGEDAALARDRARRNQVVSCHHPDRNSGVLARDNSIGNLKEQLVRDKFAELCCFDIWGFINVYFFNFNSISIALHSIVRISNT